MKTLLAAAMAALTPLSVIPGAADFLEAANPAPVVKSGDTIYTVSYTHLRAHET